MPLRPPGPNDSFGSPKIDRAAKQLLSRAPAPARVPKSSAKVTSGGLASTDTGKLGAAVAEALFGHKMAPAPRVLQSTPAPECTGSHPSDVAEADVEPLVGSILQFTPAGPGWVAVVGDGTKQWSEPVVGWAVVVIWTAYGEENEDENTKGTQQFQTEVQPVTLNEDGEIEVIIMRDDIELISLAMPGQVRV